MKRNIGKKTWGVLGKQETYFYQPGLAVGNKEKTPLNASAFDSWDLKKSKYKRVDLVPRQMENDLQQAGVVPQVANITPTPTPTITQTNTPTNTQTQTQTQTQTPSQTQTQTNTPTPSFTPTQTQTNTPTPTLTPSSTPFNLPSTPDLWYDSTNIGSIDYITSGGTDYVSGWRSIGTYNKTLTGTTTDTMPIWSASTLFPGNPKIIRFTKNATAGLRDFLSQRFDSTVIPASGLTIFYVLAKPTEYDYGANSTTTGFGLQPYLYSGNTTTGGFTPISSIAPRVYSNNIGVGAGTSGMLIINSGVSVNQTFGYSATNLNDKFLWTNVVPYPSDNPYVEINQSGGTLTTPITGTPVTTLNSFILGGTVSSGGTITATNNGAEIAEIMIYTKELTIQQQEAVQNYLRDKWRYDEWASPVPTPTQTASQTQTTTQTTTPTPSITPSATPPASGTTQAQTYLRAVVDGGGTGITSTVSAATITLFTSLVSNNLWDKMIAFYPMLGGNSSGCKFNGRNPVDTDGGYRLVFNGGWTYNASGATSNGTNAYANTFLSASTITPLQSQHLSIYLGNNSAPAGTGRTYAGAGVGNFFGIGQDGTPYWYYGVSDAGNTFASTPNTQGNITIAANATTTSALYKNGSGIATAINGNGQSVSAATYLGALNNNGTTQQYYANQYRFATIGYGLSAAQVSTLSTIINTFQTSLTRNTY